MAPSGIAGALENYGWESDIEAIYSTAPVGLGLIDTNLRVLRVNEALACIHGLPAADHLGKSMGEILPDSSHLIEPILKQVISSGEPILERELKITTARGTEKVLLSSYVPLKGADGRVFAVSCVVQDISERKQRETELLNRYQRLEDSIAARSVELTAANASLRGEMEDRVHAQKVLHSQATKLREQAELLDLANDAIFIRGLDGKVLYWNQGAERLYGWKRDEVLNRPLATFLNTEYPVPLSEIQSALFRERKWAGELVHRRRDGSKVSVASRWTLWQDENGTPQGWLQINTDITERKRAEELLRTLSARLLQTQDDERRRIARELHDSAGQLLVGLDINLMTVQREADKLSANTTHALSESVALVKELSGELRNISHLLHPPLLDEAGLPAAIRWYVERFSERSKIAVSLEMDPAIGRLSREFETTVFRIVQESLTNVHRHSGSSSAKVRLMRAAGQITVEICDEGKGLDSANHRTYSGMVTPGVGIQGMRERVRQLGGHFEVRSGATGTTICATLPTEEDEAKSAD